MMMPEDYIRTYPQLPSCRKSLTEDEKQWITSIEIAQHNNRALPESITEFKLWDKNGNIILRKSAQNHYDRKGRQTSRFSFDSNESQVLEEAWKFNENKLLDEYLIRHMRGEVRFTKFIYHKNRLEKIISFLLFDHALTSRFIFEYNVDDNISSITEFDSDDMAKETSVFTYDDNKLLIKKEFRNTKNELLKFYEYEYNAAKLTSVEKIFAADCSESSNTIYTYDGFNRLIEKKSKFNTGSQLLQNCYEGEYLISTVKELIIDDKSCKRNEWLADIQNLTITERYFSTGISFEQTVQYDENWIPQRGVFKPLTDEIDPYEIRFRTSIHD